MSRLKVPRHETNKTVMACALRGNYIVVEKVGSIYMYIFNGYRKQYRFMSEKDMYMNMYEGLVVEIIYGSKTNKQKTCRRRSKAVCVTVLIRENDKEYKIRHRSK